MRTTASRHRWPAAQLAAGLVLALAMGSGIPPVPVAPALAIDCVASPDSVSVLEDHSVFVDALANDAGCNWLRITDPAHHGQETDDPADDVGNWIYTPDADQYGHDLTKYEATFDGVSFSPSYVTYAVVPVNDSPQVNGSAWVGFVAPEDTMAEFLMPNAAAVGPDNEASQILSVNEVPFQVAGNDHAQIWTNNPALFSIGPEVWFVGASGSFRSMFLAWTPAANACGIATATVLFKDDGGRTNGGDDDAQLEFNIHVACVNDAPVAGDDLYGTPPDTQLVVPAASGLLANDSDVDSTTLVTSGTYPGPAHGSVSIGLDGSFTYTPDKGFIGADTFAYRVNDGGMHDDGLVTILVDGTAPTMTSRTPASGSTGRPRDTQPTITFDDAIRASTLTSSTLKLRDKASGTLVSVSIGYDAVTHRATLKPTALLGVGRTYTVQATSGIRNLAGLPFAGTSWSFAVTSDATRPKVIAKAPAPAATGVSRSANVTAKFSERVRPSTVTTATVRLKDTVTGSIVPATVVYDAGARKAILDPSSRLASRRTYKVLLSSSIRDRAGNRLYATSWTFKTGG